MTSLLYSNIFRSEKLRRKLSHWPKETDKKLLEMRWRSLSDIALGMANSKKWEIFELSHLGSSGAAETTLKRKRPELCQSK